MNLYQWLCLLSVPALLLAGLKYLLNQIKGVRMGVKALLRANMISEYETWHERGFAPIYAKQTFENLWVQYHAIKGPNGVMDDLHTKFLELPTERHERGE